MNIIVNKQAIDYIESHLSGKPKETKQQGFFYSDLERTYVVFDKDMNIEYKQSEGECLRFLRG